MLKFVFKLIVGGAFLLSLSACSNQEIPSGLTNLLGIKHRDFIVVMYTPYDCSVCTENTKAFLNQYPNHFVYILRYGSEPSMSDVDFCREIQNCQFSVTKESAIYESVTDLLPEPKFPVVWLNKHKSNSPTFLNTDEVAEALSGR